MTLPSTIHNAETNKAAAALNKVYRISLSMLRLLTKSRGGDAYKSEFLLYAVEGGVYAK